MGDGDGQALPFDRCPPGYIQPPARLRLREYAFPMNGDELAEPMGGHRWNCVIDRDENGNIIWDDDDTHKCRICGLKMWIEYEDVVLSHYEYDVVDGGRRISRMPTCGEHSVRRTMDE